MGDAKFRQPYTTEEIESRPFAVVISLLIGLLLASIGWNLKNDRDAKQEIKRLNERANTEQEQRIRMYEQMLFFKAEKERLENQQNTSDSLMREMTEPYVNKLLNEKSNHYPSNGRRRH